MILMSCNHIENESCSLNSLKYIIFIPQFTTNELRNSSDQTFQKQHVIQEELSLIMHSFICMCAYTHTQYKWCPKPLLFIVFIGSWDRLTTLAAVWTSAFLQTIWQVLMILRILQIQSILSFIHSQFMLSLAFLSYFRFRSFYNKVVFCKRIYDIFLFYFELILMIDRCYIYIEFIICLTHEITI